jgi:hypothetical protein
MSGNRRSNIAQDTRLAEKCLKSLSAEEVELLSEMIRDKNRAVAAFAIACAGHKAPKEKVEKNFLGGTEKLVLRKCWTDPDPKCAECYGKGNVEVFFDSYTAQREYERCSCVKWIPKE